MHSSPTPDTCSAKGVDNGHQPCGLFRAPWRSNKLQKPIISAIVGKQHIGVSPTMAMAGNLKWLSCLLPFSRVLLLKYEKGVNPNRSLDFHSAPSWFRYHFISVPCFDLYFLWKRLSSLYHLTFYFAKVCRFCQIPNTRPCLIRLKLFWKAFRKCCSFGYSQKLSTELFGVLTPRNHHFLMHVKRLYDDEMTEW